MGILDLIDNNAKPDDEILIPNFHFNKVRLGIDSSDEEYFVTDSNAIICKKCGIEMRWSNTLYTCGKCGYRTTFSISNEASYNTMRDNYSTSVTSATVLQVSGPHATRYQNNLRKNTSNYKVKQKKDTESQMVAFVSTYKGLKIPPNILKMAATYYHSVQQHCIKRSYNRTATMAECTYRICKRYGIVRKPKEIISIFGVEQKDLSLGSSILNKLHSKGLLREFLYYKSDYKSDFLNRYFKCLNLKEEVGGVKYYNFCCELIDFTQKYKLVINNIISTKCAGSIYLMSLYRKELGITKEQLSNFCQISKSTFTTFSKTIMDLMHSTDDLHAKCQRKIKNIFVRNGIASKFPDIKKEQDPTKRKYKKIKIIPPSSPL